MRRLRSRLAITYFLMVLLALTAVNLLVLRAIESFTLRQREIAAFTSTNIAVNLVEPLYRSGVAFREPQGDLVAVLRSYAGQSGARVLALDKEGLVLADSLWPADGYSGRTLTHPEVAQALAGQAATGRRYLTDTGWVLYTVAPVLENKNPVGAVFLSTSIDDLYAGLGRVARTMLIMSGAALLVATLVGFAVARTITGPVTGLTRAAQRMGGGDLAQRVPVRGRDEVATLAAAFNDMAERLHAEDERRREFLADVAHELQTPVSAIRALAEPLQTPPAAARAAGPGDLADLADPHRDLAREIEGQAERLGRLVGDLLDLARLESPKVALVSEDVDLAGLLGGVLRGLAPQAQVAAVSLVAGPLPPARVTGDGLRLEQVFTNLIGNGIKYAGAGRTVRAELARQGAEIVAVISDNGPGVPAEHLGHIFERFYRVERSRSRKGGGTGLGLAIVKRIVELHGGTVSARNREGGGIVFEVRLPVSATGKP